MRVFNRKWSSKFSGSLLLGKRWTNTWKNIHILEAMDIVGRACDGIIDTSRGYIMRGGREMENHFECLSGSFRSIPSLEIKDACV